jgi:hypothetical protein
MNSVVVFEDEWDNEIPQEPGCYWFIGDPWSTGVMKLYYVVVGVSGSNNRLYYVTCGDFMQKKDMAGKWQKILFSNLPKEILLT